MSYTKKRFSDSLRAMLREHGETVKHPAMVEDALNHAYSQLLSQIPQEPHNQYEVYTKNYEAAVTQDGDSQRYYSDLPVAVVNLPRKGGGVISVQSTDGTGFRHYPVSEQEWRLTANVESGLYNRMWGFYVNRDKIWYTRMTSSAASAGVRLSLAVQFKDFAATDEVAVPGGSEYQFLQLAYDYLSQKSILELELDKQD